MYEKIHLIVATHVPDAKLVTRLKHLVDTQLGRGIEISAAYTHISPEMYAGGMKADSYVVHCEMRCNFQRINDADNEVRCSDIFKAPCTSEDKDYDEAIVTTILSVRHRAEALAYRAEIRHLRQLMKGNGWGGSEPWERVYDEDGDSTRITLSELTPKLIDICDRVLNQRIVPISELTPKPTEAELATHRHMEIAKNALAASARSAGRRIKKLVGG